MKRPSVVDIIMAWSMLMLTVGFMILGIVSVAFMCCWLWLVSIGMAFASHLGVLAYMPRLAEMRRPQARRFLTSLGWNNLIGYQWIGLRLTYSVVADPAHEKNGVVSAIGFRLAVPLTGWSFLPRWPMIASRPLWLWKREDLYKEVDESEKD